MKKRVSKNYMDLVFVPSKKIKWTEEEQNVVLEVLQKGYKYNDKVIRVAMVKVNE